jgi:hypothetical protein
VSFILTGDYLSTPRERAYVTAAEMAHAHCQGFTAAPDGRIR